ncbi:hypothetical protein CDIK_3013 [Cucumispora dikerogammari]|nr:hypothetical protein CDIK_3013 [Cucumispora dikerogammari]
MTDTCNNVNTTINDHQRKNLIKKHIEDRYNVKDAAFLTNISYETAKKIIQIYIRENKEIKQTPGRVINKKVTPDIKNKIEALIEKNPQITTKEIKEKLKSQFNIVVCVETIRKVIYKLNITLKMASRVLKNVNSLISLKKRKEYARNFLNEDSLGEKVKVFIDESWFNLHLTRTLARSSREVLASVLLPSSRERNV